MCIIPAGTYPVRTEEVATSVVKCLLVVSADMDDDRVQSDKVDCNAYSGLGCGTYMSMRALEHLTLCKNPSIELHRRT